MFRTLRSLRVPATTGVYSPRTFRTSPVILAPISDVIKTHHREIEDCYTKALNAKDNDERQRWGNQFIRELARHAIGEDLVLYPAIEKYLPDGEERADRDREHTNEVKALLNIFQRLSADEADYEPALRRVIDKLDRHIKEEENEDLPALENALHPEESEAIGDEFHVSRKFAPTRSHPAAPDRPPYETAAALMAAPLDRLGDLFRKFPRDKPSAADRRPARLDRDA